MSTTPPEWDTTPTPTSTPAEIAAFHMADGQAASSVAFYLLGRAVSNMVGDSGRVNHTKAALFLAAAVATGFDSTGYGSYEALVARYGEPE